MGRLLPRCLLGSGLQQLDERRSNLREKFVIKLENNPRFVDWLPMNETPVCPFPRSMKYVEKPFKTGRSFRRILNFLDEERSKE